MKNLNLKTAVQSLIEKINLKDLGDVIFLHPTISKEDIKEAEEIVKNEKGIVYSDYAGIKELQFKKKIKPSMVLEKYYGKTN